MGWMVDARRRMKLPELVPAMRNYFGNVTGYGLGDAAMEIWRRPLVKGVLGGAGWSMCDYGTTGGFAHIRRLVSCEQ
jgi:hypothetical protein